MGKAADRPALSLNFLREPIDPRLTTSGGANGTRVNSAGVIVAATTPRFDYDPVTLAAKGLLVEEARTNLLLWSDTLDDVSWVKSGVTVSANTATSPDGGTTADKVIPTASAGTFKELQQNYAGVTSGTTYTYSVYVKPDGYSYVQFVASSAQFGTFNVNFDLTNGTESAFAAGTSTVVGRGISAAGNGWYRIWVAVTALATAAGRIGLDIIPAADSIRGVSWSSDGTSGVLQWGAQLEAGSFATSYIPTAGATVTRTADSVTMTGANFSDWFNASAGAFVTEWSAVGLNATAGTVLICFDGTANNNLALRAGTNILGADVTVTSGGVGQADTAVHAVTAGTVYRDAIAYSLNDLAFVSNGVVVDTDASMALPVAPNQLSFGTLSKHMRRVSSYSTRPPNATLQALTA